MDKKLKEGYDTASQVFPEKVNVKKVPRFIMLLFLFLFCAAPESLTTPGTKTAEEIAYQILTEVELQKLLKVYPAVVSDLAEAMERWADIKELKDLHSAVLSGFPTLNREVAGLEVKLKAAGMPWKEFWPVWVKTWVALMAEVMRRNNPGEIEYIDYLLKDPDISEAEKETLKAEKEALVQMEEELYGKVPEANRNLARKYRDKIDELFWRCLLPD